MLPVIAESFSSTCGTAESLAEGITASVVRVWSVISIASRPPWSNEGGAANHADPDHIHSPSGLRIGSVMDSCWASRLQYFSSTPHTLPVRGLTLWAMVKATPCVTQPDNQLTTNKAGSFVSAKCIMPPHTTGFSSLFACLSNVSRNGDAPFLVGSHRDCFDALCPLVKGEVIQVRRAVIWVDSG